MLFSFHLISSLPQSRHQYRYLHFLKSILQNIDRPRSRNVILINRLISWLLGSSDSPKMCDVDGWRPVLTLKSLACEHLLFSGAHSLKEGDEGHEAILILWLTKFLHEAPGFLLGELLTEVGKETEKLVSNHGVVVIFVIKLQDFNEVVESTLVLGVLACLVHGEDISLGEHLLSLLRLSSDLLNSLEGGVQVASTDEVTGIEGINLAISLEVIDIKGEFNCINLLLLESKFSHFELFVPLCSLTTIEGEDRTEVPMYSALI